MMMSAWGRCVITYHEHHGDISRREVGCRCGDDKGRNSQTLRQGDVEEPLARLVGMMGHNEAGDDGQHVRWAGQKQRDDVVVSQGADDSGEEVGHRGSGDVSKQKSQLCLSSVRLAMHIVKDVSDVPESTSSYPREPDGIRATATAPRC